MQDFQEDEKTNHDRIMLVEDDTTITHGLKRRVETGSGADGSDASVFQWLLLVQRDTKSKRCTDHCDLICRG